KPRAVQPARRGGVVAMRSLHLRNETTPRTSTRPCLRNIPTSYAEADAFLGRDDERPCGYATRVHRIGPDVMALRHHRTDVVVFHADESVTIDCKGWRSTTTKARLNAALADSPWRIFAEQREWQWHYFGRDGAIDRIEYEDGDRVYLKHPSGRVPCASFEAPE